MGPCPGGTRFPGSVRLRWWEDANSATGWDVDSKYMVLKLSSILVSKRRLEAGDFPPNKRVKTIPDNEGEILNTLEDNNELLFMLRLRVSSMESKITSMQTSIDEIKQMLQIYITRPPSPPLYVTQWVDRSPDWGASTSSEYSPLSPSPIISPLHSPTINSTTTSSSDQLPWESPEYRPSTPEDHSDYPIMFPERIGQSALQELEDFLHNFNFSQ
ncbi:hypothetical protein U1Q18_050896 [Sarracenia purpurea var. burkii]